MTKQDHISRVWDIIEKARVGMLTTRFAGGLRARRSQTSSGLFAAAKTAFGTTFHSLDVEATIRHGKMEQTRPVAVIFMKPDVIAYE